MIEKEYASLTHAPEWSGRPNAVSVQEMEETGKARMSSVRLARILGERYGFDRNTKLAVPEFVWRGSRECVAGYLQGMMSTDGSIWIRKRGEGTLEIAASLTSSKLELLKDIQILLSNFGIFSRIYDDPREDRSNFTYTTKDGQEKTYCSGPCYSLRLHGENVGRFMDQIGFLQERKREVYRAWLENRDYRDPRKKEKFMSKIRSIEAAGEEPVYDANQPYNHSLIFNGIVTGNCAEIPLEGYGDCCLGNINLSKFVEEEFTERARVNWVAIEKAARYGVRFLDNVLDYNADKHPLKAQTEASMISRRIGLGFTGLGDMLVQMRLKYDTDEAIQFVDNLFEKIKNFSYDESVNIGLEKGVFKNFDREKHMRSPFIQRLHPQVQERIRQNGLRNVAVLTVPPVGSGASLAGTTSGVEPIFDLVYTRRSESLSQEYFKVYHPLVGHYMSNFGLKEESELPNFFVTSHQIGAEKRVLMQATIQKHIDHAISSTVNLPREATEEDVSKIYFNAWKMGCKGITVYREGSREGVLITDAETKAKAQGSNTAVQQQDSPAALPLPRQRPKVTEGRTERVETPRGPIYVTINEDEFGLCEIFVKSLDAEAEVTGRLASLLLRAGVDPREIMEQLWRVRSREVAFDRSSDGTNVMVTTVAQGVALVIGRYLYGEAFNPKNVYPRASTLPEPPVKPSKQLKLKFSGQSPPADPEAPAQESADRAGTMANKEFRLMKEFAGICPDCGEVMVQEGGCASCKHCGYTKCS